MGKKDPPSGDLRGSTKLHGGALAKAEEARRRIDAWIAIMLYFNTGAKRKPPW
jgi:hypothetical protein